MNDSQHYDMKAIIPIGGRGTRMRPVTFTANKHFIPIGNKPLIFYPIEAVVKAGVKEVAITYNPGQLEFAKEFLGDGSKWNVSFEYILQEKPIGLANIVEVCEKWVGDEKFFLHLGDNIFVDGIEDLVSYFEKSKSQGLLPMLHHGENTRMGVPYFDESGKLVKYVEKPKEPPHDFAVPGLYFADKTIFEAFKGKDKIKPSARGEYEIPDPFQWMIDHDYVVEVKEYAGKWLDPGKFDDWLDANQFLIDRNVMKETNSSIDETVVLEGRVSIGENCVISNSKIRGPVSIGNGVVIENSFIGPYTSIYHNSKISNCDIQNSVLMEGVVLEDVEKTVDSSIIGPHCEMRLAKDIRHINVFLGELSVVNL